MSETNKTEWWKAATPVSHNPGRSSSRGIQLLTVHILHVYLFNMNCEATVYPSDPNLSQSHTVICSFRGKKPDFWKQQAKNGLKGFPLFIHSR